MENLADKYKHIPGWGIDADPEDHPNYPMKHYTGDDHQRSNYVRPVQQQSEVEILHSNERPIVSAVFGTPNPPSGLSGVIRRWAFRYSEGSWNHWLPLLMADRVNVVEGIIDDIRHGIFPNIWAEKGMNAEWRLNKKGVIRNLVITTAVIAAVSVVLFRRRNRVR